MSIINVGSFALKVFILISYICLVIAIPLPSLCRNYTTICVTGFSLLNHSIICIHSFDRCSFGFRVNLLDVRCMKIWYIVHRALAQWAAVMQQKLIMHAVYDDADVSATMFLTPEAQTRIFKSSALKGFPTAFCASLMILRCFPRVATLRDPWVPLTTKSGFEPRNTQCKLGVVISQTAKPN